MSYVINDREVTKEEYIEYIKKNTKAQWYACPMHNQEVKQITCMLCQFGHMTECHYPNYCEDAECSHYGIGE